MPQPYIVPSPLSRPIAGALAVLAASFFFAVLGALIKVVSSTLPNEMVVFFRNCFALVFILPWILYSRPQGGVKTEYFQLHLLRSMAGLGAMYCFFFAIAHLRLSEAFLLAVTGPLFIPFIAYVWIGERVEKRVRGAMILGFIGIALILKPGMGVFRPVAIVGLGAGVLAAVAMVSIRRMSNSEPVSRIVFYFTLLATLVSSIPLFWAWQSPRNGTWLLLVLIGFLAVAGQLLLTKGYSLAPAAQVGPLSYGNVVFSAFIGWLFWGETLDGLTWIGASLICIAGIIATYRTETHALLTTTGQPKHSVDKTLRR